MAAYHAQNINVQQTLETSVISLSVRQAQLIEEYQELLYEVGFEIELFGQTDFAIRSVPAILADRNPVAVLELMIDPDDIAPNVILTD